MEILHNTFTNNSFDYLKSKQFDVFLLVKNKVTRDVMIRSDIGVSEVTRILLKEQGKKSEGWVTDAQRAKFPQLTEPLESLIKDSNALQKTASKMLTYWKGVIGVQKAGFGTFKAWDNYEVDLGALEYLNDQVERVRGQLGAFSITMAKIIDWQDLQGMHGFATGNSSKLKVSWRWSEFQRFFILWSHLVAGVKPEGNVDKTWTPGAKDFVASEQRKSKKQDDDEDEDFVSQPKKQKFVSKKRPENAKVKRVCSENEKKNGKLKAVKRAKKTLFKPKETDFEYGLALSVSEEVERMRQSERTKDKEDLAQALENSLQDRVEVELDGLQSPFLPLGPACSPLPPGPTLSVPSPLTGPAAITRPIGPVLEESRYFH